MTKNSRATLEHVGGTLAPYLTTGESRKTECGCGHLFTQIQTPSGAWKPDLCDDCLDVIFGDGRVDLEAARLAEQAEFRLAQLDVPRQYRDASLDRIPIIGTPETRDLLRQKVRLARRYVDAWPDRQENPRFPALVAMRGSPGSFKTYTAWAIALELVRSHAIRVEFATLGTIVRDLRESWRRDSGGGSERKRLAKYLDADLLVIDEVSRHALYGEPTQHLYDLIAPREADLRPTILTSNESLPELDTLLGPALVSRLARWGGTWDFGTQDFRATLDEELNTAEMAS